MEPCESRNQSGFVMLMHQMLRNTGADIKMKRVSKFLEIVYVLCPWDPEEESLDESMWSKIGTKIEEYAATHQSSLQAELLLSVWLQLHHAVCLPFCNAASAGTHSSPTASLASNPSSSYKSNPDDGGGGCNLPPYDPRNEPDSTLGVGPGGGNGGARDKGIRSEVKDSASESTQDFSGKKES
ncbi:uncharacterized protein LOC144578687 [Callithrix jacchus]